MSDALIDAARRLARDRQRTGDPRILWSPDAADLMDRLLAVVNQEPGELRARHALGWLLWLRYLDQPDPAYRNLYNALTLFEPVHAVAPDAVPDAIAHRLESAPPRLLTARTIQAFDLLQQAQRTGDLFLVASAAEMFREVIGSATPDSPSLPAQLANLASALLKLYGATEDRSLLDEAATAVRRAATLPNVETRDRAHVLSNLGTVLHQQYSLDGSPDLLSEAIDALRDSIAISALDDPNRPTRMFNLAKVLQTQFNDELDQRCLQERLELLRQVVAVTPADDPRRWSRLGELAGTLSGIHGGTGRLPALDEAISLYTEAGDLAPAGHPDYPDLLVGTGTALGERFDHDPDPALLDLAVTTVDRAIAMTPPEDPDRSTRLRSAAKIYRRRYRQLGNEADLASGYRLVREALAATPADSLHRNTALADLAACHLAAYTGMGDLAALRDAVDVLRDAMRTSRSLGFNRVFVAGTLAEALRDWFVASGETSALEEAVELTREARDSVPEDHPQFLTVTGHLCDALQISYDRTTDSATIDEAIALARQCLAGSSDPDPSRSTALSTLGNALARRSATTGDEADNREAVELHREALALLPDDHPHRPVRQSNLSFALRERYKHTGEVALLQEAITLAREAALTPRTGQVQLLRRLSELSEIAGIYYERTGDTSAMDEAIDAARHPRSVAEPGSRRHLSTSATLCDTLRIRYAHTGDLESLDEAVWVARDAAALITDDRPAAAEPVFTGLGGALRTRFERSHNRNDIEEAVDALRRALALVGTNDWRTRARCLSNLGAALTWLHHLTGEDAVVDDAIAVLREAVESSSRMPDEAAMYRSNLALALMAGGQNTDAVAELEQALADTPPDHPDRAMYLINLAGAATGDEPTRIRAYRDATTLHSAPVTQRTYAADAWARAAASIGDWADSFEGYQHAVALLPTLTTRRLGRRDREWQLASFSGLVTDATAAALNAGQPERAIELLEQGRAILLAQAMDIRTDLDDLFDDDPKLAQRFVELRGELAADDADGPASPPAARDRATTTDRRHRLARAWDELLADIRRLPGRERFLRSPLASDLRAQAADGPIAVINVSTYRSDALIVAPSSITVVPLPNLAHNAVEHRVDEFLGALEIVAAADSDITETWAAENTVRDTLGWLWDTVAGPVLDALPAGDGRPPRLWWSPTGLLNFLPLHAAGHYGGPNHVMDRVVSSYTPSIRALEYARRRTATTDPTLLVVGVEHAPGAADLPGATREIADLQQRLPVTATLFGPAATRQNILAQLTECTWAHLACHGYSNTTDPSASHLLTHDQPVSILDISRLHLRTADFAFLSACSTGRGGTALADEAIHIGAAFLAAGFRTVVATLWPVVDDLAVSIADSVYTGLQNTSGFDSTHAARALHDATQLIRNQYPLTPSLWAAHLHIGA